LAWVYGKTKVKENMPVITTTEKESYDEVAGKYSEIVKIVSSEEELLSLGTDGKTKPKRVYWNDELRGGSFTLSDNPQPDDGGIWFNGYKRDFEGAIHIDWFGIVGDGSDETVNVKNWLSSVKNSTSLIGRQMEVVVSENMTLPRKSNITIDGNGLKLISNITSGIALKIPANRIITVGSITANIVKGDTKISIDNTSGIEVGSNILMESAAVIASSVSGDYKKGETFIVDAVYIDSITIKSPAYYNNVIADMTLYNTNIVKNVEIKNLSITVTSNNVSALTVYDIESLNVHHCSINSVNVDGSLTGIVAVNCINSKIKNNVVDNFKYTDYNGYGIAVTGNNIIVEGNTISGCKHNITSGSREFLCTNIHYIKNYIYSSLGGALDIHYNVIDSSVVGNDITGNSVDGFGIFYRGNSNCLISGNKIKNQGGAGIWVTSDKPDAVLSGIIIENNTIESVSLTSSNAGIYFQSPTVRVKGTIICGNSLIRCGSGIKFASENYSCSITGNYFEGNDISVFDVANTKISNNISIVDDTGTVAASHQYFLNSFGNGTVLNDNKISYKTASGGEGSARGIRVKVFNAVVINNVFDGYTDVTNTVLDESSGTATIGTNYLV